MKRKQGRVTERSRTVREGEKGGKKRILFHGNVCAYLTCLLMGDPGSGSPGSPAVRDFLRSHRRSNIHLYPDDWKKLLIPDVDGAAQAPIVVLVDQILTAKRANPDADVSALEAKIDRLVHSLYGLTPEEIQIVEESAK